MKREKEKKGGGGRKEGRRGKGKEGGRGQGFFRLAKRGGKLFIKKIREGQQFEVHFKSGPLPKLKVGFMQSNHLVVECDMNFN